VSTIEIPKVLSAEFEVLPQQADQVETEALFSAAYGGVGAGKTLGAQWKMFKRLRRYPLAGHYVTGADFEQLRGGYFLDFRNLLEEFMRWREGRDFKYTDSPRPTIILLDTGARIRALSAELAERIRSTQIQSLHAEEPQTWHNGEQVWRTLVGRMRHSVRSNRAYPDMPIQAWMTFNPGGVPGAPVGSWLYNLIEKNWKAAGYPSWRFSLRDNYLLGNAEQYIANIEANLPPHQWPVEIDGHWPTTGGGAYRSFDQSVHAVGPPAGLPPMGLHPKPLLWTLDFNVGLQCSLIAQAHVQQEIIEYTGQPQPVKRMPVPGWQKRVFYFIDEIALPNAGVDDVVAEFLLRYEQHAKIYGVTIYGDASGGARSQLMSSQSAIRTNWEAINAALRDRGIRVTWRVQSANPAQMDRVNMVNKQFRTGAGFGVLIDPHTCPEFITDLVSVQIKPGTNEIDKGNKSEQGLRRTHTSDAAGYLLYVERYLEENGGNSIKWTMVR
jgi:hypothetical protein